MGAVFSQLDKIIKFKHAFSKLLTGLNLYFSVCLLFVGGIVVYILDQYL